MFNQITGFIREVFKEQSGFIALHEPRFHGNERSYVNDAIDSSYVSSVGKYVGRFEDMMCTYTGSMYAIAVVNGTAALHMSLMLAGVKRDELVITQPLSFIATCNAISYLGASPLFVDIDKNTLGMSANSLEQFLKTKTEQRADGCYHRPSGKHISACVPMHTFGHPVEVEKIRSLCNEYHIALVEDAAESIGSKYHGQHTGKFGLVGAFSFNGNKTITSGGGGAIVTDDPQIATLAKHLTTQAKKKHLWEFDHDYIGYNYRMPNINAALACAQLEKLDEFVAAKRALALRYKYFFEGTSVRFVEEPIGAYSNYWLNAILFDNIEERNSFLEYSNKENIMTRPAWKLMHKVSMFMDCYKEDLSNAEWVVDRLVNIPSSVIVKN